MGSIGAPTTTHDIHVVLTAIPAWGHVRQLRILAQILATQGYGVSFITGNYYKKEIEALAGVEFVPLRGEADINFDHLDRDYPERMTYEGPNRVVFDLKTFFVGPLQAEFEVVREVVNRPELASKKVVLMTDPGFHGCYPIALESELARRVPLIGIGHMPIMILSEDTAPFGPGIPSQGKEQNLAMNGGAKALLAPAQQQFDENVASLKCRRKMPTDYIIDNWVMLSDLYCQLCVPELELPRSDLPSNVRYCGLLYGGNDVKPAPEWFDEYIANDKTGHPLILVTAGTVSGLDPHDLIVPTVEACRDLPVRVLVCAVHTWLPEGYDVPKNVRVAEWVPFEQVFPHTSVVVTNGGYNGINQALAAGVPMVVAGTTEDKTETTLRAAMTGAAINLRCSKATAEQMKIALQKVMNESVYKASALKMKEANAKMDARKTLINAIEEVAAKFYQK